jgi:hypothetical protein
MQRAPLGVLVCLGALGSVGASTAAVEQNPFFGGMKPTTRVVELLKGLQEQCEKDAKTEEKLYEKFVCWGKQVILQKSASNEVAEKEIAELEQYIADLDAGRIELTTERVDLEKEISELTQTMEIAEDQRNKEKADYENAVAEMTQAIDALNQAIAVLKTATEGHEEGVLAEIKVQSGHRAEQEAKEAATIHHAVELGNRFLSKGDALFLRRLLTHEVPEWDWKKLNRKATFKMSYKARSFKIQDVLEKLLESFKDNKKDAEAKETEAVDIYTKLMKEKGDALEEARDALAKMEKENGARSMSKEECQDRIDLLKEQVKNDEKYINQVKDELDYKRKDWDDRSKLRYGEIAAIGKAIHILHSDDARDLFKRSLESQGYLFLQTGQLRVMSAKELSALDVLRSAAEKTHDSRLARLAKALQEPDFGSLAPRFDPIIKMIDDLVVILQEEEASDLEKKESCEKNRAENTREAIKLSRQIDDESDTMTRLMSEIAKLDEQIKENEEAIVVIDKQLAEAKAQREVEEAAWTAANDDDIQAATTVQAAADVLKKFYKEAGLMDLVQKSAEPIVVEAGKAPPPPPTTWEDPYGGKTPENTGIIAILSMIKEDIDRDAAKAEAANEESKASYLKLKGDLEAEKTTREKDISDMTKTKAGKLGEHGTADSTRTSMKGQLDAMLSTIAEMEPGCNYYTVLFPVRVKNRQIEIDGLMKAKAILQGADFSKPDPNRELKPGDAFPQLKAVGRH